MRKEERARHANTSASSFQPKQNPQQTEPARKDSRIENEASEGQWLGRHWGLEPLEALGAR